jgi:hypothetical protein
MNNDASKQRGYSMLELSIVMVFMAMVVIAAIMMQTEQARMDRARSAAQIYTRMNNAVGSYLTNFYDVLIKLKPECGAPDWSSSVGANAVKQDYSSCAVNLRVNGGPVVAVANGLQPTPTELADLGFLERGSTFINSLPFLTLLDASGGDPAYMDPIQQGFLMGDSKRNLLPNRFMVLIQFICIAGDKAAPALFTTTGGCASNSFDLRSLVFNSQPYRFTGGQDSDVILYQALRAAGADAYLSGYGPGTTPNNDTGELRAVKGAPEPSITNPSRWGGWSVNASGVVGGSGAPNIFAMRNGYGSSGWDRYVRRDGTTPMTANWDYGNRNVSNINNLGVTGSAQIGSDAAQKNGDTVLTVKGNTNLNGDTSTSGNSIVGGKLTASSGIFGSIKNTFNAALQAVSAYIEGPLNVADKTTTASLQVDKESNFSGTSNFKGDAYFFSKAELAKLKINNFAKLGDACVSDDLTFAKADPTSAEYSKGLRLLVCNSGTWDRAQEYTVASAGGGGGSGGGGTTPPTSIKGESITIKYYYQDISQRRGGGWAWNDPYLWRLTSALSSEWDVKTVDFSPATWIVGSPASLMPKGSRAGTTSFSSTTGPFWGMYIGAGYASDAQVWTTLQWTALVARPTSMPPGVTAGVDCMDNWARLGSYGLSLTVGISGDVISDSPYVDYAGGPVMTFPMHEWWPIITAGPGASTRLYSREFIPYCTELSRSNGFKIF